MPLRIVISSPDLLTAVCYRAKCGRAMTLCTGKNGLYVTMPARKGHGRANPPM